MRLRPFELADFEAVVEMLYAFTKEVYSSRQMGLKYSFYKTVMFWIDSKKDIILATTDSNEIVGFSLCYIDDFNGLTEQIYNCEMAYVIPSKRNTRASYLLYNNAVSYAKEKSLTIVSTSRIENGVYNMVNKHFEVKPKFITIEIGG